MSRHVRAPRPRNISRYIMPIRARITISKCRRPLPRPMISALASYPTRSSSIYRTAPTSTSPLCAAIGSHSKSCGRLRRNLTRGPRRPRGNLSCRSNVPSNLAICWICNAIASNRRELRWPRCKQPCKRAHQGASELSRVPCVLRLLLRCLPPPPLRALTSCFGLGGTAIFLIPSG